MYQKILLGMHTQILPHVPHPLLLSDFLTDAYNQGGAVSMLALHGLFVLMSKHGLEYPNFYPRCCDIRLTTHFAIMPPRHRAMFLVVALGRVASFWSD
jgi:U3 small nucleolar RNA-associated protein 19